MAEGEAPAPAALIEPDERSTVSLWSSTMRQANKVDEIALILKKMTALETKLADLEGERIKVREGSEALPCGHHRVERVRRPRRRLAKGGAQPRSRSDGLEPHSPSAWWLPQRVDRTRRLRGTALRSLTLEGPRAT